MRGISQCWDNYLIDLAPDNNSTCEEAEYEEKLRWRYTSVLMHHQEAQKNNGPSSRKGAPEQAFFQRIPKQSIP